VADLTDLSKAVDSQTVGLVHVSVQELAAGIPVTRHGPTICFPRQYADTIDFTG
jgi:hypothetical protein